MGGEQPITNQNGDCRVHDSAGTEVRAQRAQRRAGRSSPARSAKLHCNGRDAKHPVVVRRIRGRSSGLAGLSVRRNLEEYASDPDRREASGFPSHQDVHPLTCCHFVSRRSPSKGWRREGGLGGHAPPAVLASRSVRRGAKRNDAAPSIPAPGVLSPQGSRRQVQELLDQTSLGTESARPPYEGSQGTRQ